MEKLKTRAPRIFISYVHRNQRVVKRLVEALENAKIEVFWDQNLNPGQSWKDIIENEITNNDFFIACFSKQYEELSNGLGTYMNKELSIVSEKMLTFSREKNWLIPVLFSKCAVPRHLPVGLGRSLGDLQFVDLSKPKMWDKGLKSIITTINPERNSDLNYLSADIHQQFDKIYSDRTSWKKIEKKLFEYLKNKEISKDIPSVCNLYIQLAMFYQHRGDYDRVNEYCSKVLQYKDHCEFATLIDTLILLGDTCRMQGDYHNALSYFTDGDRYLMNPSKEAFILHKARISLSRGFIYNHIENQDVEMELNKSIHNFDKIGDEGGKATALVYLGIHKLGKEDFKVSEEKFQQALSISRDRANRSLENFVLNQIANLRFLQGNLEEAYQLCIEALEIQFDMGTRYGVAVSLTTLSSIIQSAFNVVNMSELRSILANVGTLCNGLLTQSQQKSIEMLKKVEGDIDLPIFLCDCAITLFTKMGAKYALCEALIVKAGIYFKCNKVDNANKILSDIQRKYSFKYGYKKIDKKIKWLRQQSQTQAIMETESGVRTIKKALPLYYH